MCNCIFILPYSQHRLIQGFFSKKYQCIDLIKLILPVNFNDGDRILLILGTSGIFGMFSRVFCANKQILGKNI